MVEDERGNNDEQELVAEEEKYQLREKNKWWRKERKRRKKWRKERKRRRNDHSWKRQMLQWSP